MYQHLVFLILICLASNAEFDQICAKNQSCDFSKTEIDEKLDFCYCRKEFCTENRPNLHPQTKINTFCQRIPNINLDFLVFGSCPFNWIDGNVEKLCKKEINVENYNYMLDLPFQSVKSNLTYSNIYCAMCNDDYFTPNRIEFSLTVACNPHLTDCNVNVKDYVDGNYTPGELTWDLVTPKTQITLNSKISNVVGCRINVIKNCANDWKDEKTSTRCKSYTNFVQNSINVYQNVYCAHCNHVKDVRCPERMKVRPRNSNSFTILLDFTVSERCPLNEIYDLLSNDCKPILCGKNYVKLQTRCIPKYVKESTNSSIKSCNAIPISIDELDFLANGSIKRKNSLSTFDRNEYERLNITTYLICHDTETRFVRKFPYSYSRLTTICMSISLISLFTHIFVHFVTGKYKTLPGKNQLSLSIALFVAQLLFFTGINQTEHRNVCFCLGIVLHFFYLVVFFWMNVMAFDICKTFAKSRPRSNNNKTFYLYSIYAWFTPFCIVFTSVLIDSTDLIPNLKPLYGYKVCWISSRYALFVYFGLPLAVLLVENVFFFLITAKAINTTLKGSRCLKKSSECRRFHLYVKLAFVMGGTWILGLAANLSDYDPLWYGFVILNASQGTFIFVVFTLKKGILKNLCEKLRKKSVVKSGGKQITSLQTSSTKLSIEDAPMLARI